jgi:hypothetical protein
MKTANNIDTGLLVSLQRLPSSANGNPRYKGMLLVTKGDAGQIARTYYVKFRTRPDSSLAYCAPNFLAHRVTIETGSYYGLRTLFSMEKAS